MNIVDIESLTYEEAKKIAIERLVIKEHECFITEFDNMFGYSILVFKNGRHIYYANNYELHNGHIIREGGKEALRENFIKELNDTLFTDDELLEPINSYEEYRKKIIF